FCKDGPESRRVVPVVHSEGDGAETLRAALHDDGTYPVEQGAGDEILYYSHDVPGAVVIRNGLSQRVFQAHVPYGELTQQDSRRVGRIFFDIDVAAGGQP